MGLALKRENFKNFWAMANWPRPEVMVVSFFAT